ncbi:MULTISPECIES: tRNA (N(6)-L-threonylcarbamoyladenosine(37)-C(2))-methylthiotransferase MtaB [Calditerrivibrio]|uniref:tRNA-2-methylthio-N(6)-dimethylallyladenosine synthase n=1 Tax=Calditerrivibrio nitroreducens TaxID=477976 RepID=A0A2J6WKK4_9BACT|nr:MAG: tRNA (N(6)-L-threonylcarbamoyladenosine(37)-C(2))-methylthiotransferase MtaB [Calditerrivibrio nitroreducens]
MKIAFHTFGCKVNLVETENLKEKANIEGFKYTDSIEESDIIVINSCAVTDTAEKKSLNYLKKLKQKFPEKKIVLTGCLAEMKKDLIKDADILVTNIDKDEIFKYIKENKHQLTPIDELDYYKESFPNAIVDKTRGFLKIQDGCDAFCSYCIIPHLRGKPRSKSEEIIIREFAQLVDKGFKEIVLVGIHIGKYGFDTKTDLKTLLKKLIQIEGNFRIRLSSLELNEIDTEMIELILNSDKICKHLHIPLQGSTNKILKLMNRHYTFEKFASTVEYLKSKNESLTIGTDIITGFPGETEEDFTQGYDNLLNLAISYMHVFPFSERKGTKASILPDKVSNEIKKKRSGMLRDLSESKRFNSAKRLFGTVQKVLTEKDNMALTDNYFEVCINEEIEANSFLNVKIIGVSMDGTLIGKSI